MADRFKNNLYMLTRYKRIEGHLCTISNDDGTLFSGCFKTKIRPTDLPEWYLYGRYYKRWGYMSTKGIVDMVYRPNLHVNHFLKDDFLYISYKEKIEPVTEEDEKNISSVARDCITAITDDGISPAIDGNSKDRLFIILEKNQSSDGVQEEMTVEPWYDSKRVATKIMEEFPESGIEFLPEFSTARDNERVLTRATKYKEVVFVTFCTSECYLGTDCLTRRAEMVINCLIHSKKVSTVVHFGNPFALKPLLHVPRKIFGYSISDSQVYAIDVLAGKLEPNGRLPFDINFQ